MPAQAAITINDGQATPVAHVFNPDGAFRGSDNKVIGNWVDRSPAVKVGYLTIREQHAPANGSNLEKIRWVIERPTTETLSGAAAPSRAYANTIVVEAWIHDRATVAELSDMVAFAKNFTALTYFADKVKNRERTW